MASFIHSFINLLIDHCFHSPPVARSPCLPPCDVSGSSCFATLIADCCTVLYWAAEHCTALYSWTLYSALLRRTSVLTVGLPSLDISISSLRGQPSGHQGTEEIHSMTPSSSRLHVGCGFECSFITVVHGQRVKHAFAVEVGTITNNDLQIFCIFLIFY